LQLGTWIEYIFSKDIYDPLSTIGTLSADKDTNSISLLDAHENLN